MPPYPFTAVVGLDDLRLALLLNAVSPAVGGVLVRGEKGTAKSTIVRALAAVLPQIAVVPGCRFSCDPAALDPACPDGPHAAGGTSGDAPGDTASETVGDPAAHSRPARLVELPVGATEDRLVGSLDLEKVLASGVAAYEPGLLAAAHRGLLYVDEVNLLHDHLVDLLLDAAAMGVAHVEREGVSVRHAARFLLVGTMNPEEGELRPQLLDRFGLTVEVRASRDPAERAEVVRRRLAYEADPEAFAAAWEQADKETAARIEAARALLPAVRLPDAELLRITRICAAFEVDGMRADLVTARAATALAAWAGRDEVTAEDVRQAAKLALPHRRRRHPFDAPGLDEERLDEAMDDGDQDPDPGPGSGPSGTDSPENPDSATNPQTDSPARPDGSAADQTAPDAGPRGGQPEAADGESRSQRAANATDATNSAHSADPAREHPPAAPSEPFKARLLQVEGVGTGAEGRRSRSRATGGRSVGARPGSHGLHLVATVHASAPQQVARGRREGALRLRAEDLREPIREGREGNLVLFVVDASGSMAARQRMAAVKGAILSLLLDAYQRRDKVGLVTFRGREAEVALPPTWSVDAGAARLTSLPTGGRTPLAAGLLQAADVLRVGRMRDPNRRPLVLVITDGRATQASHSKDPLADTWRAAAHLHQAVATLGGTSIVVDCEAGPVRLGLAARLAADLDADHLPLTDLAADTLTAAVHGNRPRSDRRAA
ncbi:Magnesium chelatase [Catenulispora acidiphila DSM 44928]|uniref:Mg-protoporphyrin IX chelatase n=1 Tax=Catenulispora acidiphila (strain DSM 44928 / JCM 14897 / NBRC 102108 / NRRL B-24433 / ID139908) TaxID=479433 RepID=C7QGL6_CATAD|nr:putative cobaltochelatase [Catenulispora acidiphila]ACU74896.1 Magnesium chelatase [Catenulispora acidiphila DSM 44928]